MLSFEKYEEIVNKYKFCIGDEENLKPIYYLGIALPGEVGEVCEKIKKGYRDMDGEFTPEYQREIAKELGDVLWYVTALANELGCTLQGIAQMNVDKLNNRLKTNTLRGSGDNREIKTNK